jgi:GTP-binding protein
MPQYFITSAESTLGKEEILTYIDEVNQNLFTGSDF